MRENKLIFSLWFAVWGLLSLLFLSVYFGVSGCYFNKNYNNNDLCINTTSNIEISGVMAKSVSYLLDGDIIKEEKIKQTINISNLGEKDCYLRVKAYVITSNKGEFDVNIGTTENWDKKSDGYYYFNSLISKGATIAFLTYIQMPQDLDGGNNYTFMVTVESLTENLDKTLIWA